MSTLGSAAAPAIPRIAEQLEGNHRWAAMSAFGELGPVAAPAAPALIEQLKSFSFHRQAAEALAGLGEPGEAALPMLIDWLDDKYRRHQALACLTMFQERAAGAVPKLAGLLKQNEPVLRAPVLRLVSVIGPAAAPVREEVLRLFHNDPKFQVAAADALSAIGEKPDETLAMFAQGLSNPRIRRGLLEAIRRLIEEHGANPQPILARAIEYLDDEQLNYAAMGVLEVSGPKAAAATPKLLKIVASEDLQTYKRTSAMRVLGAIGPPATAAVEPLTKLAQGEDLSDPAAKALWKIDPEAAKAAGLPQPKSEAKE